MNPNAEAFKKRFARFNPQVGDVLAPQGQEAGVDTVLQPKEQERKPTNWNAIRTAILQKYPNLSKSQITELDDKIRKRKLTEGVKSGQISLEDVSTVDKELALDLKTQGIGEETIEPVEGEDKAKVLQSTLTDINTLLTSGDISTGRIGSKVERVQSALGLDPSLRDLEQAIDVAAPVIGKNILELDRLTDEDVRLAKRSLPEPSDTPEEIRRKIERLNGIIVSKYGEEYGIDNLPSESEESNLVRPLNNPLVNFFLGGTRNVIQDLVATPGARAQNKASNELLDNLETQLSQAIEEGDVETIRSLQDQFEEISKTQSQVAGTFSEGVEGNPLARGVGVGSEVAFLLQIPALAKGTFSIGKNVLKKGSKVAPKSVERAVAERSVKAAQSNATYSGDDLIKVGDDLAKNNPRVAKLWNDLKPNLKGQKMTTSELIKKIHDWNADAYTKGGDVASRSTAKLYDALATEARQMLQKQAPEVFAAQKGVAKAMSSRALWKELTNPQKIAGSARYAAASGVTYYFLAKLLGMPR